MKIDSRYAGSYSAIAVAVAIATLSPSQVVVAQETTQIEEILVTGTRLRTGRQDASIPIASISAEQIKLTGSLNVEDVLNTLPQVVPSRTASTNSTANPTATGAATVDLRGLGTARSLVLVNGRRYTIFDSSQTTDLNTIPTALVQRTEMVTGGASAVYGSDAIAGVMNFILRDDYEGAEVQAQYNLTGEGDGDMVDLTFTWGSNFADERGNAVISLNYFDRDSIMTTDRDFSAQVLTDGTVNGVRTLVAGGSSFVPNGRFTGIPFSSPSSIDGLDAALAAAGLSNIDGNGFIPAGNGQSQRPFTRPDDLYNYTLDNFLRIPQERTSVTTLGHYDFSDTVIGYWEGSYTENETTTGFAPSFINQSFPVEVNNPFISPQLSGVLGAIDTDGNGLVNLGINRRLVELGPRRNEDTREAYRVLLGLRGAISDWDYDLYYSYADSENTQRQFGNASRTAFASGILSGSGGDNGAPVINPFGPNISPAGVGFLGIDTTNIESTELEVFAATITGELAELPAGPLSALFGAEYRTSTVDFAPDAALRSGDVAGFNAITAASGEITVKEVFAEFDLPLIADVPGIESLSARAAYRYSDYDLEQVGGVNTFLTGLDWRINSTWSLGAQFQRAIRAPNVGEAFGGQRSFPVSASDPCAAPGAVSNPTVRDLCIANGVPAALVGNTSALQPNTEIPGLFGGNPNLTEEESDTYTVGVVFTPNEDLRISLDYFDITVDDAIASFGGSVNNVLDLCFNQIQDIGSVACQAVGRNPTTGIIDTLNPVTVLNENSGVLETSGIDFALNYGFDLANASRVRLNFALTWLDEYNLVPIADLPSRFNDCVGAFGRTCGEAKSELRANTTLTWNNDKLTVNLRHRWSDSTELDDIVLPQRRGESGPSADSVAVFKLDGQNYFDLSANYDLNDTMSVWGGIINVFDEDPPLLGSRQTRANTMPDTFSPTGIEFFLGFNAKFN